MKTRYTIGAIIACMAVSLYLRIVLPYDHIFTGEWIKFSSNDAYWQMLQVDRIAPDFPAYFTQVFSVPVFVWLLSGITWCIGLGSPTQHTIDTVGVYFPTILAALTVIPVYFIGKVMFGRMAGIVAAVLIAILPGEWLGRSSLGFTDHHVAEVLFSTTAVMFFLLALKAEGKRQVAFFLLAALLIGVCVYAWLTTMLLLVILFLYLLILIIFGRLESQDKKRHLLALHIMIFVAMVAFWELRMVNPTAMVLLLFTSPTVTTTMEMRPLFFPSGVFTPMGAWGNFTTLLFIIPITLAMILVRLVKHREKDAVLLFIWSVVMLAATLWFRRFSYFFAVNAALLGGLMVWYLWHHIRERTMAVAMTAILLCIILIPNAQAAVSLTKRAPFTPPDAWCETLEWVKGNTGGSSVMLSWWDYGYWINRIADRKAFVTPAQDEAKIIATAQVFTSTYQGEVWANCIILDRAVTTGKFWAVAIWAGKQPADFSNVYYMLKDGRYSPVRLFYPEYYQSLAVRLYSFDGKAVVPRQSTVISFNASNRLLHSIDTYATYEEAISHVGLGQRLVGTSPFISPVPLEAVDGYTLVYESRQKINGVPEVKVFKREVE